MNFTDRILDWTEKGLIPDPFVRIGIRKLCLRRLASIDSGDAVQNETRMASLVEQFSKGPIAPLPEKANEQHYEVPAAFFDLVLGHRKKYSCCYFPDKGTSLNEAEYSALERTCIHADIEDGQSILELGCGWGSLTLWLAEKYPNAKITAVSNSNSQRKFIENKAESLGIQQNVTVITCDMNEFDINQKFDRVVSVEMFEHMRNYRQLFANVARWLNDEGKLFVHVFCHREFTYEFNDEDSSDWMSRYFFSGGVMPGEKLFSKFADDVTISKQWRWSGMHYHRTAEAWLANMDSRREEIMPVFESTYGKPAAKLWFQRWRVFFLAVSELFNMDGGSQWWVSHYLFEKSKQQAETVSRKTAVEFH